MIVGRFVVALGIVGMTEASATVRFSMPCTEPACVGDRAVVGVRPHRAGADRVVERRHRGAGPGRERDRSSVGTPGPGASSGPVTTAANGLGPRDASYLGDRIEHALEVIGMTEMGQMDPGRVRRVVRGEPYPPARSGREQAGHQTEDGAAGLSLGFDLERAGRERDQVRRPGRKRGSRVIGDVGLEPARPRERSGGQVHRDEGVVDQVGADPWQVHSRRDPDLQQQRRRTDAGTGEDRRTGIGPGGQHDAVRLDQGAVEQTDASGARAGELDPVRPGVGPDGDVRPRPRGSPGR